MEPRDGLAMQTRSVGLPEFKVESLIIGID
jgi:hypothetical protein